VRAHRALRAGRPPDAVRPWLFAIARNRCRTMLAARRDAATPVDELELGFDGLADDVRRRAELRELVADLGRLPDDQREALVLFELGDLSHAEIAATIGCPIGKVKALVFQARTALIAERDARGTPCEEIRDQLEVARGGVLRRGSLRRHLRQCEPCRAYGGAVARQRAGLACLLPVAPTVGLKAAVLAGTGGAGAAAGAVGEAVSVGAAAAGAGAMATTGGIAVKGLVAKAAITIAVGAGVSGTITAVDERSARDPATTATQTSSVERRAGSPRNGQAQGLGALASSGAPLRSDVSRALARSVAAGARCAPAAWRCAGQCARRSRGGARRGGWNVSSPRRGERPGSSDAHAPRPGASRAMRRSLCGRPRTPPRCARAAGRETPPT
jgi:RNA polymerase sigma factor (sigma-70 family)